MRPKDIDHFRTRRSERAPLKAAVSFRNRDGKISYGWSRDISMGGIFIETDDRERLGSLCEINLTVKRPDGTLRLSAQGQAARHDTDGIAFKFCGLPEPVTRFIAEVVEMYLKAELFPDAGPDAGPDAETDDVAPVGTEAEALEPEPAPSTPGPPS